MLVFFYEFAIDLIRRNEPESSQLLTECCWREPGCFGCAGAVVCNVARENVNGVECVTVSTVVCVMLQRKIRVLPSVLVLYVLCNVAMKNLVAVECVGAVMCYIPVEDLGAVGCARRSLSR